MIIARSTFLGIFAVRDWFWICVFFGVYGVWVVVFLSERDALVVSERDGLYFFGKNVWYWFLGDWDIYLRERRNRYGKLDRP